MGLFFCRSLDMLVQSFRFKIKVLHQGEQHQQQAWLEQAEALLEQLRRQGDECDQQILTHEETHRERRVKIVTKSADVKGGDGLVVS